MSVTIGWLKIGICFLVACRSYILPGVRHRLYSPDENINIKTLKLTSTQTQIPYDYYQLPFCPPANLQKGSESLGELLIGDVIHNTPYNVTKNDIRKCQIVCKKTLTEKEIKRFGYMVSNNYMAHLLLDGLPSINLYGYIKETRNKGVSHVYKKGFQIGNTLKKDKSKGVKSAFIVNNHLHIKVKYHQKKEGKFSVVGFEVDARTRNSEDKCNVNETEVEFLITKNTDAKNITFTYSVQFIKSDLTWKSRWEPYIGIKSSNLHWFTFIVAIVPVVLLALLIAFITSSVLKRDFFRYNSTAQDSEVQLEDTGWKLVHGDVFRAPHHTSLFSILIGIGFQIMGIFTLLMVLLFFGFVTPVREGSIINAFIFLFVLMAFISGYFSTLVYKMLGRTNFKLISFYAAIFYPGGNFAFFVLMEFILWTQSSSGAVSIMTLLYVFLLWVAISVPLSFYGSHKASQADKIKVATKVNIIPRQIILRRSDWMKKFAYGVCGVFPFLATFLEIHYLMNSIWFDQFYFMMGGIYAIIFILITLTCEICVILCYIQLCNGDYKWWWKSFLCGGSSGVCLFLYGIYYGLFCLHISSFMPILLYLVYMILLSGTLFIAMGTVGTVACFVFINKIYSSIKIE